MIDVFIAFGANIGQPLRQLLTARQALAQHVQEKSASSLYQTPAEGYRDQPDFFNAVIHYGCDLNPEALLELLQDLETAAGRVRSFANAPRPLDLDILLYGSVQSQNPRLILPHPRMLQRSFVMQPLAEIAPQWPLAGNQSAAQLAAPLPPLKRFPYPPWDDALQCPTASAQN